MLQLGEEEEETTRIPTDTLFYSFMCELRVLLRVINMVPEGPTGWLFPRPPNGLYEQAAAQAAKIKMANALAARRQVEELKQVVEDVRKNRPDSIAATVSVLDSLFHGEREPKNSDSENSRPLTKESVTDNKQPLAKVAVTDNKQPLAKVAVTDNKQPLTKVAVTDSKQPLTKVAVTDSKPPLTKVAVTENTGSQLSRKKRKLLAKETAKQLIAIVNKSAATGQAQPPQSGGSERFQTDKEKEKVRHLHKVLEQAAPVGMVLTYSEMVEQVKAKADGTLSPEELVRRVNILECRNALRLGGWKNTLLMAASKGDGGLASGSGQHAEAAARESGGGGGPAAKKMKMG